ncbi:hypothetical protein R1flu_002449 [Riccia fluitans]|uniref:NB-ARC domain-containing protein n=1 Tax=Riccia fluitans TaxID=41844 RepID=A0ABD1Y660_9MARC
MPRLKKLNDAHYEWDEYQYDGPASVEIVFFHGAGHENDMESHEKLYETTWTTTSSSEFWPAAWLPTVRDVPRARIFSVKYDSSMKQSDNRGRYSMRILVENLAVNLIDLEGGNIGQQKVPVILVGYNLGGLVIKGLCRYLSEKQIYGGSASSSTSADRYMKRQQFLKYLTGIFYFATPHVGLEIPLDAGKSLAGGLARHLRIYDDETAQLNDDFRKLRKRKNWKAKGLGPANEDRKGSSLHVLEASMRYDVDEFLMVSETVDSITKPDSKDSSSFQIFAQSVIDFVAAFKTPDLRFTKSPLQNTVGLEKILDDILSNLSRQQEIGARTSAVVLHGTGGIGKSTLGGALFRSLQQRFQASSRCWVDRDAAGQNPRTVPHLQDQIMRSFQFSLSPEIPIGSLPNQTALLMECYRAQRIPILVFIDNILDEDELRELLPDDIRECFPEGSHLIVATRNTRVCSRLSRSMGLEHVLSHEVKELNPEMAQRLLCLHAFRDPDVQIAQSEMKQVLEACDGLPLALEVVGRYLREDRKVDVQRGWGTIWKEAVNSLKNWESITGSDQPRLQRCLEFSYQKLSPDLQQVFLDVVFCFSGSPWRELCALYGEKLKKLKQRALVKKGTAATEGQAYTYVKIHALVSAMGKKMGTSSRSHFKFEVDDGSDVDFRDIETSGSSRGQDSSGVRGEICDDPELVNITVATPNSPQLNNLRKLKLVDVASAMEQYISTYSFAADVIRVRLECPFIDITLQFVPGESKLEELGVVSGRQLHIKNLTEVTFPSLRKLVLQRISELRELPLVISKMHALESLSVRDCDRLQLLPTNLEELKNLRHLDLSLRELKSIPESVCSMASLMSLTLENCSSLEQLASGIGNIPTLRLVAVKDCPKLTDITESLGSTFATHEDVEVPMTSISVGHTITENSAQPEIRQEMDSKWKLFFSKSTENITKVFKEAGIERRMQPVTLTSMNSIRQNVSSLLVTQQIIRTAPFSELNNLRKTCGCRIRYGAKFYMLVCSGRDQSSVGVSFIDITLQFVPGESKLEELGMVSGRQLHIKILTEVTFPL